MPPLSPWDKVLYPTVIAGGVVVALGMAFGSSVLSGIIARANPTVLATRPTASLLALALAVLFFLSVMVPLMFIGEHKGVSPIFARSDVIYGRVGGYRELYPVFGKYRIGYGADAWVENTREKKQLLCCLTIALAVLLLFPLTLFSRYDLHEDMSLTVRSIVNSETTRYDPEDVTSVILAIEYNATARRATSARYRTTVTVKTSDGISYKFSADPETMAAVTARISPSKIRRQTDISVADYIERRNLNEEDAAILRNVFAVP
jgi:hypothetical protein